MNQKSPTVDAIEILKVTKKRNKYLVEITPYEELSTCEEFNEEQLIEYRIYKGRQFLVEEWNEILNNRSFGELFDRVLKYLSYGMHTEKEIKDYLDKHNASMNDSRKIINRLKSLNFLNDYQYANEYLCQQIKNLKGPIFIKNEMINKGIDKAIIEEVIALYDEKMIRENVLTIIDKELPHLNSFPIAKQKAKIYQKLLRIGYTNNDINYGLNVTTFTSHHEERLIKEIQSLINKMIPEEKIIQKMLFKGYQIREIKYYLNLCKEEEF